MNETNYVMNADSFGQSWNLVSRNVVLLNVNVMNLDRKWAI